MKDNDIQKLIIRFGEYEKTIFFPIDYNTLQGKIMSLFNIPKEKESQLIINYKNYNGDATKISSQEEYAEFLQKLKEKELPNIISISFHQILQNKIKKYKEDIYDIDDEEEEEDKDKDEISLRQGHIFMKNQKQKSEFNKGRFDINKILKESNDEKDNENNMNNSDENIFKNEIIKSVLPSVASFPTYCNICEKFPIMRTMFFCNECQLIMCEDCEKKLGYNHRHTYYKVRNNEQYQEVMNMQLENEENIPKKEIKIDKEKKKNKNKTRMDKLKDKKESINGIFNSILGFMKGDQEDNNKKQ